MNKPIGWHLRKNVRVDLDAQILVGHSVRDGLPARVFDVSPRGCRLEFAERAEIAHKVWVRFAGLEPLEAWVCWNEGLCAGIEFKKAIHPLVFELLTERLAAPSSPAAESPPAA